MAAVLQQVQGGMWLVLGLALGATLLSVLVRSAAFKGWWGEYKVRRWLAQDLDAQHYHCAHNITLRRQDGSTSQIDHVVISPYGVFVLETKHLRGWIFGGEKQRTWTQTIYLRRTSFPSPLHQNWGHIKALEELLQLPPQHLHSVVVFTGDCQFKTAMPAHVTQGRAVTALIRSYLEEVLDTHAVAQLVSALSHHRLEPTRRTHKAHVAQLQQHRAPQGHAQSATDDTQNTRCAAPACTGASPLGRRAATASVGAAHAGRTAAGARALPGLRRQCGAPQLAR